MRKRYRSDTIRPIDRLGCRLYLKHWLASKSAEEFSRHRDVLFSEKRIADGYRRFSALSMRKWLKNHRDEWRIYLTVRRRAKDIAKTKSGLVKLLDIGTRGDVLAPPKAMAIGMLQSAADGTACRVRHSGRRYMFIKIRGKVVRARKGEAHARS